MKTKTEILLHFLFPKFSHPPISRFSSIFIECIPCNSLYKKKTITIFKEKILQGEDKRTSIIIKNLPKNKTKENLKEILFEIGNINFLYLPYNKITKQNSGFAFVNFINYKNIILLLQKLEDLQLQTNRNNSKRPIEICYSKPQGKLALTQMFNKKNK